MSGSLMSTMAQSRGTFFCLYVSSVWSAFIPLSHGSV